MAQERGNMLKGGVTSGSGKTEAPLGGTYVKCVKYSKYTIG